LSYIYFSKITTVVIIPRIEETMKTKNQLKTTMGIIKVNSHSDMVVTTAQNEEKKIRNNPNTAGFI